MARDEPPAHPPACTPAASSRLQPASIRTLVAPTGLGMTLATLVGWLWDRQQRPQSTPRRLVYQLPLRTLSEQIAVECRAVMARLGAITAPFSLPSTSTSARAP